MAAIVVHNDEAIETTLGFDVETAIEAAAKITAVAASTLIYTGQVLEYQLPAATEPFPSVAHTFDSHLFRRPDSLTVE